MKIDTLWQSIIVLKDRCYMALCGENPPQAKTVCEAVSGVDEHGQWATGREETASVSVEPVMDTLEVDHRDVPMHSGPDQDDKYLS